MEASNCPSCGASVPVGRTTCSFCGQHFRPGRGEEARLPAWTQGISAEGYSDGNFDAVEYPAMPLSQALALLESMPVPPQVANPANYCPPALGFGERNISRLENGGYFLWPEDEDCSLEMARQVVELIYSGNAGQALTS